MVTSTVPNTVGASYSAHVNPQWVRLLALLEMNVRYERCLGCELFTADGRRILDFLSGYCVHNAGHNHPAVIAALRDELESCGLAMIQTHVADLAGELGEKLCRRAGGRLTKVFFGSSGSEGWKLRSSLLERQRAFEQTVSQSLAFEILHDQVAGSVLRADVVKMTDIGWLKLEIVRASRSKRCFASGLEDRCAGRILIATERSRRVSRARYTSPIPPAPSGACTS